MAVAIAGLCALLPPVNAIASSGAIQFGGNITNNNACSIIVGGPGTISPNPDGTRLSSKNTGGQRGIADIYSIWRYDISVSSPNFFAARSGPPASRLAV